MAAQMDGGRASARPFADAAPDLAERWGLPVMPLDGKVPMVKGWQRKVWGPRQVANWAEKSPTANVGLKTGECSRLTVVDVDDLAQRDTVIEVCGPSPLEVRTPRGGVHIYYQHQGERNRCGILSGVDVRGEGGQVVVPPSIRDDATPYRFAANDWFALPDLPPLRRGALDVLDGMRLGSVEGAMRQHERPAETGTRNSDLFQALMVHAPQAGSQEALTAFAERLNAELANPLPLDEVRKTARSAWRYQAEGRNWIAGRHDREALMHLYSDNADAALLVNFLRDHHAPDADPFTVAPKGMAASGLIGNWGHCRYRDALRALMDAGLIVCVHQGRKKGDPSTYQWPSRVLAQDPKKQTRCVGVWGGIRGDFGRKTFAANFCRSGGKGLT
jgi:hypothetical protein